MPDSQTATFKRVKIFLYFEGASKMDTATLDSLRRQLTDRQARLRDAMSRVEPDADLVRLIEQVDSALARLGTKDYARCLICKEDVEEKDLFINPLLEYCLCNLSPQQQSDLEDDLQLARRIQAGLLPDPDLVSSGWEAYYRYEPLGVVSGDYCDLWVAADEPGTIYFAVGDVSGKGVAASLLMAHLQAAFRSLVDSGVPLAKLVAQVNRQLLRAAIPTHYATLACGRLNKNGDVEIVNAGHCAPLIARSGSIESIESTGFPVGLVVDRPYDVAQFRLSQGDTLLLYTDGLTEARGLNDEEFGPDRLAQILAQHSNARTPRALVQNIRENLANFLGEAHVADDLTILAVQRSGFPDH